MFFIEISLRGNTMKLVQLVVSACLVIVGSNLSMTEEQNIKKVPLCILYFDINKTIIPDDKVGGKTGNDTIQHALAENIEYAWDGKNICSYSDYVKKYKFPGDKHDKDLKTKRNDALSNFINYLKYIKHDDYEKINNRFIGLCKKLESKKNCIFDSFYKGIQFLRDQEIKHVIVLRTFGEDLDSVMKEISLHEEKPNFFGWKGKFLENKLFLTALNEGQEDRVLETTKKYIPF